MSNQNSINQSDAMQMSVSESSENLTEKISNPDEVFSQKEEQSCESLNLSAEQLNEMLHDAYLRGRNENIEARIETDSHAKAQRSVAGELLIKGLTGVAKAIFNPGRRSIWPPRRG